MPHFLCTYFAYKSIGVSIHSSFPTFTMKSHMLWKPHSFRCAIRENPHSGSYFTNPPKTFTAHGQFGLHTPH
ncbi:hypothetical protein XELAEV_18029782mg [Xenopus laevis]|uniref:Uncharacterized protein n=1 Tax=Xenopus laevis TaxID=8355 RepID=A0A974HI27_XENLA|nr:hypothetical protein XELAEV_18029782mg [Xenopus laevis]